MQPDSIAAFYSCVDAFSVFTVPQPIQHMVIGNFAEKNGGKTIFFLTEEWYSIKSQEVILEKIKEKPKVSGVIFYRLAQFFRGDTPNFDVMKEILTAGYGLYFARERFSITSLEELEKQFVFLSSCFYLQKRDENQNYFESIYDQI